MQRLPYLQRVTLAPGNGLLKLLRSLHQLMLRDHLHPGNHSRITVGESTTATSVQWQTGSTTATKYSCCKEIHNMLQSCCEWPWWRNRGLLPIQDCLTDSLILFMAFPSAK